MSGPRAPFLLYIYGVIFQHMKVSRFIANIILSDEIFEGGGWGGFELRSKEGMA